MIYQRLSVIFKTFAGLFIFSTFCPGHHAEVSKMSYN